MSNSHTVALNTSSSKQNYAFAKTERFASTKKNTNMSCYEIKTQFSPEKKSLSGGFGAIDRFGYYNKSKALNGKLPNPSPANYKIKG